MTERMEPNLYLDFDGVLHPNFIQKGQPFYLTWGCDVSELLKSLDKETFLIL
jgi:hypothetical protein